MRIIFLTIGLVLLAISLVKILSPPLAHTFEIIGYQFNDPTFSATANSTLTKAEQISKELINSYEKWNTTSFYLGWTGLFFTSLATLIAGLHRKKSNSNGTEFLNTKLTSIGLLCALASIINLAHDRISDIASNKKNDARTISTLITQTATELKLTPENESILLQEIDTHVDLLRR